MEDGQSFLRRVIEIRIKFKMEHPQNIQIAKNGSQVNGLNASFCLFIRILVI